MSRNFSISRLTAFVLLYSLFFLSLPKFEVQAQANVPQEVFSNTAPITINTAPALTAPTTASVYPSNINVSGMTGTITRVAVTLRGLTHPRVRDLDFLLVSPTGAKFMFLSDPTGADFYGTNDGLYAFTDDAANFVPQAPFLPGIYKPSNFDGTSNDTFPAPAPAPPYGNPATATFASIFNGADPNGTWSLYAVDDQLGNAGSINSGWDLTITTDGMPQTFSNHDYTEFSDNVRRASPYPSVINVSGLAGVVSNVKVTLNGLSHTNVQDIDILLVNPNGSGAIIMSDVASGAANNVDLTFDRTASNFIPNSALVSGTYLPTNNTSFPEIDIFPSPAPIKPYYDSAPLSGFNNFSPNGEWQLYVVDDNSNNSGVISGGWSLDITTMPAQQTPTGCAFPNLVPSNFDVGSTPTNLAVGDFNNDMNPDVAVTNQVSSDVSILLGDGSGGFAPQMLQNAGSSPYAVAVGQFNGDNNQDLVVVNSGSNNVSILLGNGNGTFSAPTNFAVGSNPISVAVGDFNSDGKQDLAVANFGGFFTGTVSLLFGNGNGGFSLPTTLRTRSQPAFVKAEFLNGDNFIDLVVANFGANSVSTFFGNGNGTFGLSQNLTVSGGPVAVEVANVIGDSNKDLIVAQYNGDSLQIFNGSSAGGFTNAQTISNVGPNPISVVAADILGDSTNRLAVALSGTDQAAVSTVTSISGFQLFSTGFNPNAIAKGDFNRDGKVDLITANAGSNNVTVLTNVCIQAKGNLFDFNGDRRTDFSVFRPVQSRWFVNTNTSNPDGYIFGRATDTIVPADYDGDRITDFAIYRPENGLWFVLKNNQNGSVSGTTYQLSFGLPTDIPAPADYDGDGKADIAVFRPSSGNWFIRRSSDYSLQATQFGMDGDKPVAADYDGDGQADIAVFRPSDGTWYILGSTSGFFARHFGISTDRAVPADYDGDGQADVAVFRDGIWYVLKSSDGGFISQNWGLPDDIPVPGDYDGDGKFDFAVFRPSNRTWFVLRSSNGGSTSFPYGLSTDIPLPSAFVR